MSSLLERIERQLAACTDAFVGAELRAERAAYLVRIGEFVEAREVLGLLREQFGDAKNARVSIWLMLVEGLLLYFERVSHLARDRVLRARAIAVAFRIDDLRLLTGAWLAHLEFERGAYSEMLMLLQEVLTFRGKVSVDLKARVSIILGNIYSYCGRFDVAGRWFEFCRQSSIDAGDRATMGALMYNRASFGLEYLRVRSLGYEDSVDVMRVDLLARELESAWAFQVGTRVLSLVHLIDVSRARAQMLRGDYARAIEILKPIAMQLDTLEDRSNRSSLFVDILYCRGMSADSDVIVDLLRSVDDVDILRLDVDERIVAAAMCLSLARRHEQESLIAKFSPLYENSKKEYECDLGQLSRGLSLEVFGSVPSGWSCDAVVDNQ
ncbi:MAG: hypothetical protein WAQ05_20105 [Rubrivivax sp.]